MGKIRPSWWPRPRQLTKQRPFGEILGAVSIFIRLNFSVGKPLCAMPQKPPPRTVVAQQIDAPADLGGVQTRGLGGPVVPYPVALGTAPEAQAVRYLGIAELDARHLNILNLNDVDGGHQPRRVPDSTARSISVKSHTASTANKSPPRWRNSMGSRGTCFQSASHRM